MRLEANSSFEGTSVAQDPPMLLSGTTIEYAFPTAASECLWQVIHKVTKAMAISERGIVRQYSTTENRYSCGLKNHQSLTRHIVLSIAVSHLPKC